MRPLVKSGHSARCRTPREAEWSTESHQGRLRWRPDGSPGAALENSQAAGQRLAEHLLLPGVVQAADLGDQ
ncbi:MAG: hypothetical protein KDB14_24190, partial [Planctomycetales bacterium]|nr:hypothetical protein [Planctomycetales bacterium]